MTDRPDPLTDFHDLVDALAERLSAAESRIEGSARELAETCLRTITTSGYEIRSRIPEFDADPNQGEEVLKKLASLSELRLRDLVGIWRQLSNSQVTTEPELHARMAERVLESGEPLLAYDIAKVGLESHPDHVRLKQLGALALARSGASRGAALWLQELVAAGHNDEETLGILARTYKDLWEAETDPVCKEQALREAFRLYLQGFEQANARRSVDGAIYTGINTATTALLLGRKSEAVLAAASVAARCRDKPDYQSDYWALATLGECALIARRFDDAAKYYSEAVAVAGRSYANIASTRRNAASLLKHMEADLSLLSNWFPLPTVAVFAGHIIDRPGALPRFPHSQISVVQARLRELLLGKQVGFGYSAAACGGDLLFQQAVREVDGESYIVLPLPRDVFVPASVAVDPHRDWLPAFEEALELAARVTVVNDFSRSADGVHFEYANHVMTGLAMIHAQALGVDVVPIAVWDERPPRGPGGTGSTVESWRELGWQPTVVNPLKMLAESITIPADSEMDDSLAGSNSSEEFTQEVHAMLFADVVGYSKLAEEEIPLFVRDFMGSISKCVRESGVQIETGNTWGDAIYFVFSSIEDAGLTALRITEHVQSIDWTSRGFRTQLSLRTGLHVGPVYGFVDPLTNTRTHSGAHVSRAARIEPIAPPGEVYASEAFAAVATAEGVTSFHCDYVGVTPMAKGYGDFPTYHVRRGDH